MSCPTQVFARPSLNVSKHVSKSNCLNCSLCKASIKFIRTVFPCYHSVPVGKEEGHGLGAVTTCLLCEYIVMTWQNG